LGEDALVFYVYPPGKNGPQEKYAEKTRQPGLAGRLAYKCRHGECGQRNAPPAQIKSCGKTKQGSQQYCDEKFHIVLFAKAHFTHYAFIVHVYRSHNPKSIVFTGGPVGNKRIIIPAAGITALSAGVYAIGFRLIGQVHDHPPAWAMVLLGGINDVLATSRGQIITA
jgi:hypothetical protein